MVTELRVRNQSQQLFNLAMTATWRNGIQLHDPSLWLLQHPEMEEQMLRDADIKHAVQMRRHMIAGSDWKLNPRNEAHERAPMAVMVGTELFKGIKHFDTAKLNLARAFFSGARFGKIHGVVRRLPLGDGVERDWWVPTRIEDLDKRNFRIVPTHHDNGTVTAHWEKWNIATGEWLTQTIADSRTTIRHVYQDDQASLGHGQGLREALAWWWYAKEHVFMESLQAVERFAQGIITAKVDGVRDAKTGEPNTELIRLWRNVLEDMRSRHVLVYDAADQVETVQMDGQGWNLLKDIREELKHTITTLILGSTLPTTANEGGSYALGGVQQDSTEMLVGFDRGALDETMTDDGLGAVWFKNRPNLVALGIAEQKPRYSTIEKKTQNPKERAETAAVLNGMGMALATEDVAEQTGFRVPDPDEPQIAGADPSAAVAGFAPPGQIFRDR